MTIPRCPVCCKELPPFTGRRRPFLIGYADLETPAKAPRVYICSDGDPFSVSPCEHKLRARAEEKGIVLVIPSADPEEGGAP